MPTSTTTPGTARASNRFATAEHRVGDEDLFFLECASHAWSLDTQAAEEGAAPQNSLTASA